MRPAPRQFSRPLWGLLPSPSTPTLTDQVAFNDPPNSREPLVEALIAIATALITLWALPHALRLLFGGACLAWELFCDRLEEKARKDPYA